MSKEPFKECPQYTFCSANHCPHDPMQDERENFPGDDVCRLGKTRRMRIAAKYPDLLPKRGLWPVELSSLLAWERRPEHEKQAIRERLQKSARKPSDKAGGHAKEAAQWGSK